MQRATALSTIVAITAAMATAMIPSRSVHAALVQRLGGLAVYDTDLDTTWLANANLPASMPLGIAITPTTGIAEWGEANAWIDALNAIEYLGVSTWRLPIVDQLDGTCTSSTGTSSPNAQGFNCTGSGLGHLFYTELGGTSGSAISSSGDPDLGLFVNLQDARYWTGTTDTTVTQGGGNAWAFTFSSGEQTTNGKISDYHVLPLADGDVFVPLPPALVMLLPALASLFATRRSVKRV